jgi:hypothetical protein
MRLPKLKRYYYAMTSDAYIDFAVRRELDVDPAVSIDLLTGVITGRTMLHLSSSATQADTEFRQRLSWTKPVYVLHIPAELIDRRHLTRIADDRYEYRASLTIPHCGVERIELDTAEDS